MPGVEGVEFAKGHGAQNDFVVFPDPDGTLELTDARVVAVCDRHRGLGADGVLRVVRWAALDGVADPEPGVEWFMDYRNADGSVAQMCGNGVRVFARYLAERGWVCAREQTTIGTRAGVRRFSFAGGDGVAGEVSVDMGPVRIDGPATATVDGLPFVGIAVDVGNPHLACVTSAPIGALDLTVPPGHDPVLFPHGVNVEFVSPWAGEAPVVMRVHERGVGETRACGTGTVAAAVAVLRAAGRDTGEVTVRSPGGLQRVTVSAQGSVLHGPAVIVARGVLDAGWWDALR
jgi:diaminopimelate epimerase